MTVNGDTLANNVQLFLNQLKPDRYEIGHRLSDRKLDFRLLNKVLHNVLHGKCVETILKHVVTQIHSASLKSKLKFQQF